jgi:DNA repair protein RecO (recombination protein O)
VIERASGIILRTRLLTETSLIVHWLTAEAGRLATVARGARQAKSPFRGKLDLFHEADLAFRRSARSELHTLTEVVLRETFPALRVDWQRLNQAAYGVALVELTTEMDTPIPEVWSAFREFLAHVASAPVSRLTIAALELKQLALLGLLPDLQRGSLSAPVRQLGEHLVEMTWDQLVLDSAEPGDVDSLLQYLHGFLIYHLNRLPRGRAEALAIKSAERRERQ